MKRTISIRLDTISEHDKLLLQLQEAYHSACNQIVPDVVANRCWNRVALHRLVYSKVRDVSQLGSQMVCNSIYTVCKAYAAKEILPKEEVPKIQFRKGRSIHFDKRTYSIKNGVISLMEKFLAEARFAMKEINFLQNGAPFSPTVLSLQNNCCRKSPAEKAAA